MDEPDRLQRERRRLVAVSLAGLLAWVAFAGKDLGFDLINHHLYLGFAWWHDRHGPDLFAAAAQSYQNPLGFVPLYAMVAAGWPAWAVGLALGLVHAACAWPLARLVQALWPAPADGAARWLALSLSLAAPVYLLNLGTSSFDPVSALLVLLALVAWFTGTGDWRAMAVSGALLGAACGLKLSNVVFLAGLLPLAVLRLATGRLRPMPLLALGAGMVAGAMITFADWGWKTWSAVGDPLFPLLDGWFHSPYAPPGAMGDQRFIPPSWAAALRLPLDLVELRNMVVTEAQAPDLRPLAALALGAVALWRLARQRGALQVAATRPAAQLLLYVSTCTALWLPLSGNGRYAIALFMLVGPLVVVAARTALPRARAHVTCAALLLAQLLYFGHDGQLRYTEERWDSAPYLDLAVPERLRRDPFLHLTVGTPSYSAVAAFMHPAGAMSNVVGAFSLPADGPLGQALRQRLRPWQGRTRVLFRVQGSGADAPPVDAQALPARQLAAQLQHLGVAVDWNDCLDLRIARHRAPEPVWLRSCAARSGIELSPENLRQRACADRVFARIEGQCPHVFAPRPLASDNNLTHWQRRYTSSGARITVSPTDGVVLSHFRTLTTVNLGSADDVAAGRGLPACEAWQRLDLHGKPLHD